MYVLKYFVLPLDCLSILKTKIPLDETQKCPPMCLKVHNSTLVENCSSPILFFQVSPIFYDYFPHQEYPGFSVSVCIFGITPSLFQWYLGSTVADRHIHVLTMHGRDYCNHVFYLQFLQSFLHHLEEWQANIQAREGFSKAERDRMFLSKQTYEGIVTTGKWTFQKLP